MNNTQASSPSDEVFPGGYDDSYWQNGWSVANYILGSVSVLAFLGGVGFIFLILFYKENSPGAGSSRISTPKVGIRSNGYNLYLVFLLIPDALNNIVMAAASFMEASRNGQYTPAMCNVRVFAGQWYYFCLIWLNAVVAQSIFSFLSKSARRQHLKPPTQRAVIIKCLVVFLFTALVGAWSAINTSWSLTHVIDMDTCNSQPGGTGDNPAFGELAYMIVILGVVMPPIVYTTIVAFRIWCKKLLPPEGRRRSIALYFGRIMVAYYLFLLPAFAFILLYFAMPEGSAGQFWIVWAYTLLGPLQTFVTLKFAMAKEDIGRAGSALFTSMTSFSRPLHLSERLSSSRGDGAARNASSSGNMIAERNAMDVANAMDETKGASAAAGGDNDLHPEDDMETGNGGEKSPQENNNND